MRAGSIGCAECRKTGPFGQHEAPQLKNIDMPKTTTLEKLDIGNIDGATVIIDIDGTLTADGQVALSDSVRARIQELRSRNVVFVFSNHRDMARNEAVATKLECPLIGTVHRKPSRKVLDDLPPHHRYRPLVVIGDKILVDGLFARRVGARFVWVSRVKSSSDRRVVKVSYLLDDLIAAIGALW